MMFRNRSAWSGVLPILLPALLQAQYPEDADRRSLLSAIATDEERMALYRHMGQEAFDRWSGSLPADSLTCRGLHRIAAAFHDADPSTSMRIAERALGLANKAHAGHPLLADLEHDVAYASQALERYAQALLHFRAAAFHYAQAGDAVNAAECVFYTGDILTDLGDTARALASMWNYLELAERNGAPGNRVEALRAVARTQVRFGQIDSALALFDQAYRVAEQARDSTEMGLSLVDAGAAHLKHGDLAMAEGEFRRSAAVLGKRSGSMFQHHAYQGLAATLAKQGNTEEAIGIQEHVLALARAASIQGVEAEAHVELASLLDRRSRSTEAMDHAQQGLRVATTAGFLKLRARALKELSDIHRAAGRYAVAIAYQDSLRTCEDSLRRIQGRTEAVSALARMEYDRALVGDSLSDMVERERMEATLVRTRTTRTVAFVLVAASVLIAFLLLNRARLKRRLHMEQLRARLARDLHDDIGSTLSSINILSAVARKRAEAGDSAGAAASLVGISERSQRLQRNMNDIVWSVDPNKDSVEELIGRMREFGASVLEPKGVTFRFSTSPEVPSTLSPVAKSNVYLIFKEALNNAAKHADATEVHASLTHAGNQLRLTVKDNGQGLPAGGSDPAGSGNGLRNMMTRAEEVEGKLEVRSEAGGGTCIELTLRA